MYWFMDSRFNVAYEKAEIVLKQMDYTAGKVDINDIMRVVADCSNVKIQIAKVDFSKMSKEFSHFGAAMSVTDNSKTNRKEARVLLNVNMSPQQMRFSMAHELGHLITEKYSITDNEQQFHISTHIDADFTSFDWNDTEEDVLVNEQIANVFALLVLLPKQAFTTARALLVDFSMLAEYFDVDIAAIRSRAQLIDIYGK